MQRFQVSPSGITGGFWRSPVSGFSCSLCRPILMLTVYTLAFEVVYNAMLRVGVESRGEFGLLLLALVLLMLAPLAMEVPAFLASPAQKTGKVVVDVK